MNICMEEFISFVKLRQLFPYMAFVYAWIVPLWADQLLLQLLMEQFDALPIQCRHIEHMGAQWLSGRVLDSRLKGRGFEPHRRHCVVVLEQDTFILA